jgi:hypothetical protein
VAKENLGCKAKEEAAAREEQKSLLLDGDLHARDSP